jgi:PAS domain S-box-containing protein
VNTPLRVLLVEDNEEDALLVLRELSRGGYDLRPDRVETADTFRQALQRQDWDLIIADYSLPGFTGLAALAHLRETSLDLPFIIVSGAIGEEVAVQGMKAGAHDYLLKGNLSRLVPAVERELREAQERRDRRRAEAALRENAQRLHLHFSQTPLGVIEWNLNFEVVAWNPAAEVIFGFPAQAALGRHGSFIVPQSVRGHVAEVFQQLQTRRGGFRNANPNVTQSGRVIDCEWYNTPLVNEAGQVIGVASLVQDVTERKRSEAALLESEKKFRDLVATVPGVVYQFRQAPDGRRSFPFVSEAVTDLFGIPAEEAMRQAESLAECLLPEAREPFEESIRVSLLHLSPWLEELPIRARTGEVRWIRGHAVPERESDGSVLWQGVLVDITERKEGERARAQLEGQLRQAQKMEAIGTLAGGIAHDFNNILDAIIPYTHLAKSDVGDNPPVQECLDQVLQAAERAKNLVQQILAFSRKQKQERRPIQLQEVVREALKLLRSALPSTIAIQADLQPDAPAILADPTQLHQVIMNLCTNAEHALRGLVGILNLRLSRCEIEEGDPLTDRDLRPGPYLKLTVSDTGRGMDPETLKRAFDPFFTTKAPGEGTGLGLSVVHGIVKEHEGAITVSSQPGRGTTFDIFLPVLDTEAAPSENQPVSVPHGHGEHVLIVDDEPAICSVAQRTLERLGYRVTAHTNPAAALTDFQTRPRAFDLALTDLTMPVMTGVDLALRLLEIRPDLPIVLATGFGGVWTPESARRLGIRDVILKPIAPHAIAAVVHHALHPPGG